MTDELKDALDAAARRMRRKPSEVVRMAIEAFLRSPDGHERPASRVRHLLGSLNSGIPDLAERHREHIVKSLRNGR